MPTAASHMPAAGSGTAPRGRPPMWSIAAHALGNVFLGMAIGLLVYYGLTDLAGRLSQQGLLGELESLGDVGEGDPAPGLVAGSEGMFDWTGWAQEDEAYWLALPDGGVFGRLIIPRMELDVAVVKGHSRANLKRGPAWVDYTSLPSSTGTVGISGHRTTYGAPFRTIDELAAGDTIDLYSPFRRYRYRVDRVFSVTPDRTDVFDDVGAPRLVLTACHPPYSARYRLIVIADLIDVRRFESPQLNR